MVDHIPVLSEVHLELAKWISEYYMCSLFEAIAPMLPPKTRTRSRVRLSLTPEADHVEDGALSVSQVRIIKYIRDRGEVDQTRLAKALGDRVLSSVSSLVRRGLVKTNQSEERSGVPAKYDQWLTLKDDSSQASQILDSLVAAPRQKELLVTLMNSSEPILVSEARKLFGSSIVKALLDRGMVAIQKERVYRNPLESRNFKVLPEVKLTAAQINAAKQIACALVDTSTQPRTFLLHGVTGSGKTEIYLDALTRCIAGGRKAIFLVPEIALTHQTIERLEGRFPGKVAVQHSGLKLGERSDQWWRLKQGSYDIVVGSRGALFAPQQDLGLVIVDEEHEWSYKQEGAIPRYHARDVALRLAALTDSVVVLGSASPDVLSYRRAERGIFKLLSLPDRITVGRDGKIVQTSLAEVSIIDMRREARDGNTGVFSRTLLGELASCLDAGEQAILFLNRRGYRFTHDVSGLRIRREMSSVRCGAALPQRSWQAYLSPLWCSANAERAMSTMPSFQAGFLWYWYRRVSGCSGKTFSGSGGATLGQRFCQDSGRYGENFVPISGREGTGTDRNSNDR